MACSNNLNTIEGQLALIVLYSYYSIDQEPGQIVIQFINTPKNGCVSESGKNKGTCEVSAFKLLYSVLDRAGCTA